MGGRRARTTRSYADNELLELTKKSIVGDSIGNTGEHDDPFEEWNEEGGAVAMGSQSEALPATSRTATLADPMTTGLLAEVARRTSTVELDPSTVEVARKTREIDPEAQRRAIERAARNTPTVPPPGQKTKRR
jgi:hypothetical protein